MKRILTICLLTLTLAVAGLTGAMAADSIVLGVPTSLGYLEGKESLNAVKLAVDEINAAGGVKVAGKAMKFSIEAIDIRDAAPGVPVPEALLGIEKMILSKKPAALVVGPFRSEALTAGMDLLAKHKVPMLGTIAMTPKTEGMIAKDPKYKYVFRTCLNAKYFVGYLVGTMAYLNKQFGFNKVYIMNQDVAWARITAQIVSKVLAGKLKFKVVGHSTFPVGSSNFSAALTKAKMTGAQIILPVFDMPQSGILVKQWKAMKVPAMLAGFISPLAGDAAWKTFDQKIGGVVTSIFELGSAMAAAKYPKSVAFYKAYEKKFGKTLQAGHGPAPAYESVYILKDAIEKAGSLKADDIVAALEKTDRAGVMGRIKFTKGHQVVYANDPAKEAIGVMLQWTDKGERKIVFPPSVAEASIQLPPGLKSAK